MGKSNYDDIDQLFNRGLAHHEIEVGDKNAMWQRIIDQKRKKRYPFFLSGAILLVLTCGLGLRTIYGTTSLSQTPSEVQFNNQGHPKQADTPFKIISSTFSRSNVSAEEMIDKKIEETTSDSFAEDTVQSKLRNPKSSTISNSKPSLNLVNINLENNNNEDKEINETILKENEIALQNRNIVTQFEKANLLPVERLNVPTLALKPVLRDKNPLNDCVVGNDGKVFIDIYSSIMLPMDQTSLANDAIDRQAYLDLWNTRYTTLPAIGGGIKVGYEMPIGVTLSGGIEYQKFESQYKTIQQVTERTTIYDPEAYFYYDDNNQVVFVGDSVTAVTTYDRTLSFANTTSMLNVPIDFSYRLLQKGGLAVSVFAGANFNLSLTYKGHYLRSDGSLVAIDDSNEQTYVTTKLGLGLMGGVRLGYLVNEHIEAYVSPTFKYNRSSYWQADQAIQQSRHFIGTMVGLRYHF